MDIFISETCPYSRKVLEFLQDNKIDFVKHDIANPIELKELVKLGGMEQVPFLFDRDNNIKMYESDEIINYLSNI